MSEWAKDGAREPELGDMRRTWTVDNVVRRKLSTHWFRAVLIRCLLTHKITRLFIREWLKFARMIKVVRLCPIRSSRRSRKQD
ncbi:hypothetical protein U1Q18_050726 [Sarracenia purpurea var. burkii]